MRRTTLLLALGLVASAAAARGNDLSFTTSANGDVKVMTCADLQMSFWDKHPGDVINSRRAQTVAIPLTASSRLRIAASERGGIRVQPSSDGTCSALVCEIAAAKSRQAAEAILDDVRADYGGGELMVRGPDDRAWGCYIILSVPRGAVLDLSARNGELAIRDVDGRFTLRTENGPISITDASGVIDAEAQNGPIDIKGHQGDVRLKAENGPVGVKLDRPTWEGEGLEASTQNGPIKVELPEGVRTGVRIEGTAESPVKWSGSAGRHWGTSSDGNSKIFRFGDGPTRVRVSTVNGPIEIKSSEGPKGTRI